MNYEVFKDDNKLIKAWTKGVSFDDNARAQVDNVAAMPFIHKHVAIMPDVHWGMGATVGSVVATKGAIIPAAVGVDIGCGMIAVQTSLKAHQLPDNLKQIRTDIEAAVPHGRSMSGGKGDRGAWDTIPPDVAAGWAQKLAPGFEIITAKRPGFVKTNNISHLGTLGTGNHFIEICLDLEDNVWVMLHSGSRGVGNRIGTEYIQEAKKDMERHFIQLPDKDLAYLVEGSTMFKDYIQAVDWAQQYASLSREIMMARTLDVLATHLSEFHTKDEAINCHHNYVSRENHFGANVLVTRKGAVRARKGDLGIIPGSMGARSFIVRGLGNPESFCSCSHGAGRVMGRKQAIREVSADKHFFDLLDVECNRSADTLDETPSAYKDIDAVMAAQSDLVEIVHTLKQVVCVKG